MAKKTKKAVILLSGGLDSSTVLYYAKKQGYKCHCLIFNYGQRHKKELKCANKIATKAGCSKKNVKVNLPWNSGALLDKTKKIPFHKNVAVIGKKLLYNELPATYVPGRNTIFASFALSYAESIGADNIFIGANSVDYSGYPDCRPGYYRAWNNLLKSLGVKTKILVPLIKLSKSQIIKLGTRIGVPYELTWSCYKGGRRPCGTCDSCRFRLRGFEKAGRIDPLISQRSKVKGQKCK